MTLVWVLLPVAYLLGTFPSAHLTARATGHNVMAEGSGNPGASNIARLAGWKAGLVVLAADFAKGAVASGIGMAVEGRSGAYALGVASVVGHIAPVTRRFKGGKGVATGGGALVVSVSVDRVGTRCGVGFNRSRPGQGIGGVARHSIGLSCPRRSLYTLRH